jgi:hypothetical protein
MNRRLFSSFPNSSAGAALLLLRVSVSVAIVIHAMHSSMQFDTALPILVATAWISAALLVLGICSPIAAGLASAAEIAQALLGQRGLLEHLLVSAIAFGLVLLGPGAWSIDAYLYGRKRLI